MAKNITHPASMLNLASDTVVDLLDVGAGTPYMEILETAVSVVLITFEGATAFDAAAAGTATGLSISDGVAIAPGTVDNFKMMDGNAAEVWAGSAGLDTGTFDLELDNNIIASGQTVSLTSISYEAISQ